MKTIIWSLYTEAKLSFALLVIQQLYDSNAEKVSKKTSSEEKNEGARKTKIFKNEINFFFQG